MDQVKQGDLVAGKFKLMKKIGSGSFGDIYSAICVDRKKIPVDLVAVKFEKEKVDKEVLHMEMGTLSSLQGLVFLE
jgi:hypothetical protein